MSTEELRDAIAKVICDFLDVSKAPYTADAIVVLLAEHGWGPKDDLDAFISEQGPGFHDEMFHLEAERRGWVDGRALRERLVVAEERLVVEWGGMDLRLRGKIEGIRLALSYLDEALRGVQ